MTSSLLRPHFSLNVRMSSARTIQSECGNEEGKQNRNMADGTTMAFVTGREFEDIFPVWDWHQVSVVQFLLEHGAVIQNDLRHNRTCWLANKLDLRKSVFKM